MDELTRLKKSMHSAPFLRWAGSKRQLLPTLARYWNPTFSRYIEPFAGSAVLYFHLKPHKAILADINADLIEVYATVRSDPEAVALELSKFKGESVEYYQCRSEPTTQMTAIEKTARFIYLNRFCFNGLYRTNTQGKFNVPFGGTKNGKLPDSTLLTACSKQLSGVELMSSDFEHTLSQAKQGDFVYLDPPYSVKNVRTFNEYDSSRFSKSQVDCLKNWLTTLDKSGIHFVLSYGASEEADTLKEGFNHQIVTARRNIAGFVSKRRTMSELIITNMPVA